MRYWLFKSEASTWSWEQQVAKGDAGEEWDGVRNYRRRILGARHCHQSGQEPGLSQKEKSVVGIVEVCALAHPDSTTDDDRWECVDIKAVKSVPNHVTLDMCKADPRLTDMVLVNNTRLSVQPVSKEEWDIVCGLGGL